MTARKRVRKTFGQGQLVTATLELLKGSKLNHSEIARATGIGEPWLSRFARGIIVEPGANRTELLYTYLSGASFPAQGGA